MKPWLKGPAVMVAALATLVVACGGTSSSATPTSSTPFRVLAILPLSGGAGTSGQAFLVGLKAAAESLNKQGGIIGHKISIEAADDQTDATKANSILVEKLSSGTTYNLIAALGSGDSLAMAPTATKNKVVLFCGAQNTKLNDPANYPYLFDWYGTQASVYGSLKNYLVSKGYSKIGLLSTNDAGGTNAATQISNVLKGSGVTIAATAAANPTSLDLTPQLQQLQAANIDALVTDLFGTTGAISLRNRDKLGWKVPYIGDPSTASNDLVTGMPVSALSGVSLEIYKINAWIVPEQRPAKLKTIIAGLHANGGSTTLTTVPLSSHTITWDYLQVLNLAAKQANSIDPDKLKAALENLKQPSDLPYVSWKTEGFSPTNHFVTTVPEDYTFVPPGVFTDGMYKPVG